LRAPHETDERHCNTGANERERDELWLGRNRATEQMFWLGDDVSFGTRQRKLSTASAYGAP
jgi:hypothetical protein